MEHLLLDDLRRKNEYITKWYWHPHSKHLISNDSYGIAVTWR